MLVLGVRPGRHDRHRLVDEDGDVRHHTDDGDPIGQVLLDEARSDPGREADDELIGAHGRSDLREQGLHVLRLHHQDQGVRPLDRRGIGERRVHPVLPRELTGALLAAARHRDLLDRSAARADQARYERLTHLAAAEEGDLPSGHLASPVRDRRPGPCPATLILPGGGPDLHTKRRARETFGS